MAAGLAAAGTEGFEVGSNILRTTELDAPFPAGNASDPSRSRASLARIGKDPDNTIPKQSRRGAQPQAADCSRAHWKDEVPVQGHYH